MKKQKKTINLNFFFKGIIKIYFIGENNATLFKTIMLFYVIIIHDKILDLQIEHGWILKLY